MTTCACGHDRDEHDDSIANVGCLSGWNIPRSKATGCRCRRFEFPLIAPSAADSARNGSVSDAGTSGVLAATPTARHAVYIQFDDPATEPWYHPHALVTDNGDGTLTVTPGEHVALAIPALIPDPRTTTEVPF